MFDAAILAAFVGKALQFLDALWLFLNEEGVEGGIVGEHLIGICVDELRKGSQCFEIEFSGLGKGYNCTDQFFQFPLFVCLLFDGAEEVGKVSPTLVHNLN